MLQKILFKINKNVTFYSLKNPGKNGTQLFSRMIIIMKVFKDQISTLE